MRVKFFVTPSGRNPVLDEIRKHGTVVLGQAMAILDQIEAHGMSAAGIEFKKIRGRLWEIKDRGTPHRFFYVLLERDLLVVLAYHFKTAQKARRHVLDMAEERLARILEQMNEAKKTGR